MGIIVVNLCCTDTRMSCNNNGNVLNFVMITFANDLFFQIGVGYILINYCPGKSKLAHSVQLALL